MSKESEFIFGLRPIIEAIRAGKSVDRLLVKKGLQGSLYYELITEVRKIGIPYQFVPAEKLNRLTRKSHQGVIAWLSEVEFQDFANILPSVYEKGEEPLLLILDGISDVRNFGAIARTAECHGVHALIIPEKGSARINADAIKTSTGALHLIPVCRVSSIAESIDYLKNSGLKIIAATEKTDRSLSNAELSGPAAMVMGAEDTGISKDILRLADEPVSIPLKGSIKSLNVSVAAGILLYEINRQRDQSK